MAGILQRNMLTVSLLSEPGSRRRIPSPVFDPPRKWAILDDSGYREEELPAQGENEHSETPLPAPFKVTAPVADATPHLTAAAKLALHAVATAGQSPLPPWVPWEGSSAPHKRSWLHLKSMFPPAPPYSLGLTPSMLWGCLQAEKYPGESVLLNDPSQAQRHLEMVRRALISSGHPEGLTDSTASSIATPPTPPPPGAGVGFFSWTRQPLEKSLEEGPAGRGWGRISQETRAQYHFVAGRNDPGMLKIVGFSYATTEGVVALDYEDEREAILAGLALIDRARYTANVVVESVGAFKLFTLVRATVAGLVLPDWLIYPPGRCWLTSLTKFAPRGESDPHTWLMRTGVACGEKACSRLIAEPGAQWLAGVGNPSIAARTMVSSIVKSPYFYTGMESAPDLISRPPTAST